MGGRGAGKKYTVKTFLDVSSKKSIDGIRNSIWLAPSSSSTNKVVCKICKTQGGEMKELSVGEGDTAVTNHSKGDKHQANLEKLQTDPGHDLFDAVPKQA